MRLLSTIGTYAHDDASPAKQKIYQMYQKAFKLVYRTITNYPRTNVYSRDWDVLIILDACRADLMNEVASEYEFVGDHETIYSVGSSSGEWLDKTFVKEHEGEIQKTAYITGNVKTHHRLDADNFTVLDEVWKYAWDDEHGTILPRALTDRAITNWREVNPDRMIVHYMQPHFPSIPHPELGSQQIRDLDDGGWKTVSIWDEIRAGKYDLETVRKAYLDNLRVVLDDVTLLLRSISADKVVLTADHGNAMGEWGFYDHPGYHPLRALREVPWVETTADSSNRYEPSSYDTSDDEVSIRGVRSRLENLGYIET